MAELPDVSDEKIAENRTENGGYFAQILWYYAVDEFDGLRDKVEAAVPANHGSKPCSFLQHIKNREVVISNHFDWMPGSQLVDVIEVHDWSEIAEGLLDISGRVTAFWMRCRMDVTNGVDNARVTALGERWVQFAEERHPSLQRESLPFRRHCVTELVARLVVSVMMRNSERGSNRVTKTIPLAKNDWDWMMARLVDYGCVVSVFSGVATLKVVRRDQFEGIRVRKKVFMIRINSTATLDAACALFGDRIRRCPRIRPSLQVKSSLRRGETSTAAVCVSIPANNTFNEFQLPAPTTNCVLRRTTEPGFDLLYSSAGPTGNLTLYVRYNRIIADASDAPLPLQAQHQDLPGGGGMQPVPALPAEPSQYVSEGTTFTADLIGHDNRERYRVFECVGNEISLIVEQSSVPGRVGSRWKQYLLSSVFNMFGHISGWELRQRKGQKRCGKTESDGPAGVAFLRVD